jgi:hypothetical protein
MIEHIPIDEEKPVHGKIPYLIFQTIRSIF